MLPFVLICMRDESLCFSMTLMLFYMCNCVSDIDNIVSVFYLFLFSILKSFTHG